MASKLKKQSKAAKPDCKVWAQVGDELLAEYLNKPIEGVEGHECWLVVAPGDVLAFHCQAKPGMVDEFVLVVDGIIRACEVRRNTIVVFDKALHRAPGRGKQPGAVFRSDMVVQLRDEEESRMAEAGEELSKVGSIIIEGWCKSEDPLSTKEKVGESLSFATYEESREWYDVNRFVNPSPGHLPPFEVGFNHAENRCASKVKFRTRVNSAGNRNTAEWKVAYKYVFNLRSTTEMHQLGQMDVPVRNPKASLFAEDPEEEQTEVKDTEEPEEASDEEPEEVVAETPEEEKVVKPKPKPKAEKADKSQKKSDEAGKAKTAGTSKEKPKSKPKIKTAEKSKDNSKASSTVPPSDTIESSLNEAVHEAVVETMPVSKVHELLNEKVGDARKFESAPVTQKKMSLPGLKSAPASRASRVRSPSVDSNASQALGAEVADEPLMSQHHEQELPQSGDTLMTDLPVTPPPSSRKNQSFLDTTEPLERMPIGRRVSLPSYSIPHLENAARTYIMSHESPSFTQKPTSRKVTFLDDGRSFRAESEVSDAPTEVADPAEMQARMDSQGWSSGSSGHLVESQGSIGSKNYYESDSMTPERNHTEPSPILGSPLTSFSHVQTTEQDETMESYESPSTQLRQEVAQSFGSTAAGTGGNIRSSQKVSDEYSLAVSVHDDHKSPFTQPESFITKRKADESTGNGLVAESARPRKTSIAPANRSIIDSLRRQQEENDRLEQELNDLRLYNATLETIRELRKHSHGVQESIDAEKARQAQLEAELGQ